MKFGGKLPFKLLHSTLRPVLEPRKIVLSLTDEIREILAEFLEFDSIVLQTGDEYLGFSKLFVDFCPSTLPLLLLALQTYEVFCSLIEGLFEGFVLLLALFLELQGTIELGVQSIEVRLQR